MEKSKVSIFFLLLILCAFTWTIYSKFIKNEKGLEESFTEDEFIDFLYQNLGLEDPHDVDIHEFEYDMIETTYQVMDVEASDFQLKTMQNETIKIVYVMDKQLTKKELLQGSQMGEGYYHVYRALMTFVVPVVIIIVCLARLFGF